MTTPDETLVARLAREFNLLNRPLGPMEDEEMDKVCRQMDESGKKLACAPSETIKDVLAKLDILSRLMRQNLGLSPDCLYEAIAYALAEGARDDLAVLLLAEREATKTVKAVKVRAVT